MRAANLGQAFATSSFLCSPCLRALLHGGGLSAPNQLRTGTGAPNGSRQPVLLMMEQDTDSTGATWPHPGAVRPRKSTCICDTPWAMGSSSRWLCGTAESSMRSRVLGTHGSRLYSWSCCSRNHATGVPCTPAMCQTPGRWGIER